MTIGTSDAGRLPAARHRVLVDQYYVPLEELVGLGTRDLQQRTDIARIYGESAALVTFLMQNEEGRYQEPLVEYLSAVYAGRADTATLAKATGHSLAELDGSRHTDSFNQIRLATAGNVFSIDRETPSTPNIVRRLHSKRNTIQCAIVCIIFLICFDLAQK